MQDHKGHDLHDFMRQVSVEMAAEYQRIQKRSTEDPGTAGDQGEENWATLLRDWLPPSFQVVTKGRIIGSDGSTSPQVDVIVLKDVYPKKLLDKKLYLAGGVAAAFECKITLKSSHIEDAVRTARQIKICARYELEAPTANCTHPSSMASWLIPILGQDPIPIRRAISPRSCGSQIKFMYPTRVRAWTFSASLTWAYGRCTR